ncbi:MAG: hydrolase [Candidatus Latescibacterota bacterium]|jgi:predicted hydrolase (HD superfamily)
MPDRTPSREEALALLHRYNVNPSLLGHARAVEATMRHFARLRGGDEEMWGAIGLVHDLDYEQFPEQHCHQTAAILRAEGWPESWVRATLSHGWGICTEVEPQSELEKTLYAVDELTGFVTACALVRPSKSVRDLETRSVRKKWKQASFAAGVDRQVVERGAALLGIDLDELTGQVIEAMRGVADEIGL